MSPAIDRFWRSAKATESGADVNKRNETKCYMKTTHPKIVLPYFVFSQKFMMRIAATQIGLLSA